MANVTAEGVPAQVGAVLPLCCVGVAGAGVAEVAVLDLRVESEPLVHGVACVDRVAHSLTTKYKQTLSSSQYRFLSFHPKPTYKLVVLDRFRCLVELVAKTGRPGCVDELEHGHGQFGVIQLQVPNEQVLDSLLNAVADELFLVDIVLMAETGQQFKEGCFFVGLYHVKVTEQS